VMIALEKRLDALKMETQIAPLFQLEFYNQLLLSDVAKTARNQCVSLDDSEALCEETKEHILILETSSPTQLIGHAYTFFVAHAKRQNPEPLMHPIKTSISDEELLRLESTFNNLPINDVDAATIIDTASTSFQFLASLTEYTHNWFDSENMTRDSLIKPQTSPDEVRRIAMLIAAIITLFYAVALTLSFADQPSSSGPKPNL
jgi:hypothetical protein